MPWVRPIPERWVLLPAAADAVRAGRRNLGYLGPFFTPVLSW